MGRVKRNINGEPPDLRSARSALRPLRIASSFPASVPQSKAALTDFTTAGAKIRSEIQVGSASMRCPDSSGLEVLEAAARGDGCAAIARDSGRHPWMRFDPRPRAGGDLSVRGNASNCRGGDVQGVEFLVGDFHAVGIESSFSGATNHCRSRRPPAKCAIWIT
jgi:hypothetical protein